MRERILRERIDKMKRDLEGYDKVLSYCNRELYDYMKELSKIEERELWQTLTPKGEEHKKYLQDEIRILKELYFQYLDEQTELERSLREAREELKELEKKAG